jgi:protein pelota
VTSYCVWVVHHGKVRVLRILELNLKKGFVKVVPESVDDFWHLYNVVYRGDRVYASTTREMKVDEKYGRPKRGVRVPVFLGVTVEDVGWDRFLGRLRVHGTICEAPETVPTGAHHTLNVTVNTPLTIVKKSWARHEVERLRRASASSEKPVVVVCIDDEGYVVATTAQYGVDERVEERVKLPGKLETDRRSEAFREYFKKALKGLRQVWMATHGPIAIIGVGFVKDDFARFVKNEAADVWECVADVKSVNSGGVAGIHEALRSGVLLKTLKKLRVAEETEVVEEVLKRLGKSEGTVVYGLEEVKKAAALGAVERLVLTDKLLRDSDDDERLLLEEVMETVEKKGGAVTVVSTEHEAGAQLGTLGGIAGLLRFRLFQG